jgi:hypothetical protein
LFAIAKPFKKISYKCGGLMAAAFLARLAPPPYWPALALHVGIRAELLGVDTYTLMCYIIYITLSHGLDIKLSSWLSGGQH